MVTRSSRLSSSSRDPLLTVRRVERHQRLIELLVARGPEPVSTSDLADFLGVSARTAERDLARIRESGVPLASRRGPGGGAWLEAPAARYRLELDPAEIAALIASMVALGPTATDSAASAARKLVAALTQ